MTLSYIHRELISNSLIFLIPLLGILNLLAGMILIKHVKFKNIPRWIRTPANRLLNDPFKLYFFMDTIGNYIGIPLVVGGLLIKQLFKCDIKKDTTFIVLIWALRITYLIFFALLFILIRYARY